MASTIANALKNTKDVHMLVVLTFGGLILRYAHTDLSIPNSSGDDYIFKGLILNRIFIGNRLDLRELRSNIQNVVIELANESRIQDYETTHRIDNGDAKVYLWCTGLDWTDIEDYPIYSATVRKDYHTIDRYVITLMDRSDLQFDTIPEVTINLDTWPNHRTTSEAGGPTAGRNVPIVFGSWSRGIPLLTVDPSSQYITCMGPTKTLTTHYGVGSTMSVYTSTGSTSLVGFTYSEGKLDGQGNTVGHFGFSLSASTQEQMHAGVLGLYDGGGEITGTAGNLLQHPSDIIRYIMRRWSTLTDTQIDLESLHTMRELLSGWKCATYIDSKTSALDVIDRILKQCGCIRVLRMSSGKLGVMTININTPLTTSRIARHDLSGRTVQITKTPIESLTNRLRVRYGLNPATKEWESELRYTPSNNALCARSSVQYGDTKLGELLLPDVQDANTAVGCANRYLTMYAFRRDIVDCTVPMHVGYDVHRGDATLLTISEAPGQWADEQCILLEREFMSHPAQIRQKWLRIAVDI